MCRAPAEVNPFPRTLNPQPGRLNAGEREKKAPAGHRTPEISLNPKTARDSLDMVVLNVSGFVLLGLG